MRFSSILYLLSIFVVTSCAPQSYVLKNEFDANQAMKAIEKGNNSISGEAFLRQNGGGVVTCAGYEVSLVPETLYARERMEIIYGNAIKGYNPVYHRVIISPDNPQYHTTLHKKICSSTGHFEFNDVKDGNYFLTALVVWDAPNAGKQGGSLMERVSVKGGEKREITLTH